jgi:intein/homing endonuclease
MNGIINDFNFTTKSGVRLIAALLGDGCLDKKFRIYYANTNRNLINGFINDAKIVFGDNLKYSVISKRDNPRVKIVYIPQKFGKIISQIGIVPGRKVINNPHIPSFIFNLNKEKILEFISQIIDDEGSISISSRHIRIKFAVSEDEEISNLIKDIKKLLSILNIDCSVYQIGKYYLKKGPGRKNWQIEIHSSIQLKKLYSSLNLRHKQKKQKFRTLINSFQVVCFPKKKCTKIYLSKMKTIEKEMGYFTSKDLIRITDRNLGHIQNTIHKYYSRGLIYKIQDVVSDGTRFYPARYRVIE